MTRYEIVDPPGVMNSDNELMKKLSTGAPALLFVYFELMAGPNQINHNPPGNISLDGSSEKIVFRLIKAPIKSEINSTD